MTQEEQDQCIRKCRQQDRKAQKLLYETYYGFVYTIAARYSSSKEETKELTNDIFFRVFEKIEYFKEGTQFKSWLSTVAIRLAIDKYRTQINQIKFDSQEVALTFGIRDDLQIIDKLDVEEKIKLVQKLSPAYRTVFNLYIFEQYTHEEIADLLKISTGTSKSNLSKARIQLKNLIAQYHFIQ